LINHIIELSIFIVRRNPHKKAAKFYDCFAAFLEAKYITARVG